MTATGRKMHRVQVSLDEEELATIVDLARGQGAAISALLRRMIGAQLAAMGQPANSDAPGDPVELEQILQRRAHILSKRNGAPILLPTQIVIDEARNERDQELWQPLIHVGH